MLTIRYSIVVEPLCLLGCDWTDGDHMWVAMETIADFLREKLGQSSSQKISVTTTTEHTQEIIASHCCGIFKFLTLLFDQLFIIYWYIFLLCIHAERRGPYTY